MRFVDPTGAYAFGWNAAYVLKQGEFHNPRGYLMRPGVYEFKGWTATITADGIRDTPDNHNADCVIVALGDSFTFGFGVEDGETWVNLLAGAFPAVRFVNTALPGYSATNIRGVVEETTADGFIYLVSANDMTQPIVWSRTWQEHPMPSATRSYLIEGPLAPLHRFIYVATWPDFDQDIEVILSAGPILVFTPQGTEIATWFDDNAPDVGISIDVSSHPVSLADNHPNAQGQAIIAAQMEPYIREWLPEVCG